MNAFELALTEAGFVLFQSFKRYQREELGCTHWQREGFLGYIEIYYDLKGNVQNWAHRTPASGPGTGVRPVGGTSLKKLVKEIK